MNQLKNLTLVLTLSICFFGCNSSKKAAESQNGSNADESFLQNGYVKAVLNENKSNSGCGSILINLTDSKEVLDPIDFEYTEGKSGQNIWLKYNSLRMQNRCTEARPIKVLEIKKRDE
ncbi:hypothetical protein [Tenacibaculum sp. 190524A05c]|uniref:hypothetical protein n=1 Tax=Tenacibaculum platacis TaxID=3137852 RepID=UPI0031FB2561